MNRKIVCYSGRFQPFHINHYKAYVELVNKFGKKNVYIATSNKVDNESSPFNFNEKQQIINTAFKIPKSNIVQVKSPYAPKEVLEKFDPESTTYIAAVGEKDSQRLVDRKYFDSYSDANDYEGYANKGYVYIIKLQTMKFNGKLISGTEIRNIFKTNKDETKRKLFNLLYTKYNEKLYNLIAGKLTIMEGREKIFEHPDDINIYDNKGTIIKNLYYRTPGAYAFGWWKGKCFISNERDTHYNISHVEDYEEYDVIKDRDKFNIPGRLWTKQKIISFWKYPKKSDMKKKINAINKEAARRGLDIKIDFNSWKIEILTMSSGKQIRKVDNCTWDDLDDKKKGEIRLIPLNKYTGSEERSESELAIQHVKAPEKKFIDKLAKKGKSMSDEEKKRVMKYYRDKDMKRYPELYEQFLSEFDITKLINEVTNGPANGSDADDGPSTWYRKFDHYKKYTINKFLMQGWKIIDYILSNSKENNIDGGHRIGVSYFPAGVVGKVTPTNYKDLKGKAATNAWLKDIKKTALQLGYEFINWKDNLDAIKQAEDSSKEDFKQEKGVEKKMKTSLSLPALQKEIINIINGENILNIIKMDELLDENKGAKNSISLKKLMVDILNSEDNKILLTCGGAAGHMAHPFEDNNLTFGDFKELINRSLTGQLNKEGPVSEKIDGQNIMVSWKNGQMIAARNKGQLRNFGENALNKEQIKVIFDGRGQIQDAFYLAMQDLESAMKSLSKEQRTQYFGEGKKFINLEILYPNTTNVIPYGISMLVFHSILEYNENGKMIDHSPDGANQLQQTITNINKNIQNTFAIEAPKIPEILPSKNFEKKRNYFVGKLTKLQSKFNLKDNDTLGIYHKMWWENFINKKLSKFKYTNISKSVFDGLVNRWAFNDKSYKIANIKKDIKEAGQEKFLDFVISFDKEDHFKQIKKNIGPFEEIFLELGVEVAKNLSSFIAVNPDEAIQSIRKDLEQTIKAIEKSNDISAIEKMKVQLNKLNKLGGMDSIMPTEGVVFIFKGKVYKYTGTFAPINQLLGILKYAK